MKSQTQGFAQAVLIDRDHWDVPVRVRLPQYLRFSRRLDRQLAKLVTRWVHAAAPNALGQRPRRK